MRLLKSFLIAGTALALTGPAFAGRDQAQIMQQERAAQRMRAAQATAAPAGPQEAQTMQQEHAAQKMRAAQGLAGPTGPQGEVGPGKQSGRVCSNSGHPSERVRC
ncbi:MAG: hypothetical protein HY661_10335 [Betaproteobacteria bacterium]|nr:hypothetical protein [Betaproteobacteria bacterium]